MSQPVDSLAKLRLQKLVLLMAVEQHGMPSPVVAMALDFFCEPTGGSPVTDEEITRARQYIDDFERDIDEGAYAPASFDDVLDSRLSTVRAPGEQQRDLISSSVLGGEDAGGAERSCDQGPSKAAGAVRKHEAPDEPQGSDCG